MKNKNPAGLLGAMTNGWSVYLTLYGKRTTGGNTRLNPEPLWRVPLAQCNLKIKNGVATYEVPTLIVDESVEIIGAWLEGKTGPDDYTQMAEFDLGLPNSVLLMGCTLTLENVTIRVD